MTITAYPLAWPAGWKRTDHFDRTVGRFGKARRYEGYGDNKKWIPSRDLTIAEAVKRVNDELARMGLGRDDVVVSTNLKLRLDGLPRSDQREPDDPGAAVYWETRDGGRKVMAIDQYLKVADNLAAIAATLDAMRAIERHGGALILERAFTGFTALPAPSEARQWWEVLGVPRDAKREDVKAAYRRLASAAHPDTPGGSHERMAALNAAQEAALKECAA
jgi:hypothetical protein